MYLESNFVDVNKTWKTSWKKKQPRLSKGTWEMTSENLVKRPMWDKLGKPCYSKTWFKVVQQNFVFFFKKNLIRKSESENIGIIVFHYLLSKMVESGKYIYRTKFNIVTTTQKITTLITTFSTYFICHLALISCIEGLSLDYIFCHK